MVLDPIERYPDVEFPIEVSHNPTIVQFPSGKTWACAGSHVMQVPTGTTREDLRQWMKWELRRPQYEIVEIKGSRGTSTKSGEILTHARCGATVPASSGVASVSI